MRSTVVAEFDRPDLCRIRHVTAVRKQSRRGDAASADEELGEDMSKLMTHRTVQQEVDGTVDEYDHIPDVAEWNVHLQKDVVVDTAKERQNSLRQFGDDGAQDDGDQHRRRAVVVAGRFGLESSAFLLKQTSPPLSLTHGANEQCT